MARSTRPASSRQSSSRRLSSRQSSEPIPSDEEDDVVRPYQHPERLESPFGTDRMTAAISIPHRPSSRIPQQRRVFNQRQRSPPATAALPAEVQASLRRSAAARANNVSAFNDDRSIIDSLEIESVMNTDAAVMEIVDENNGLLPHLPGHSNGTLFIDGIDYRFHWKNWSNWFVVPPSS